MKTSDEIRAVAWSSLWKGRWLWKILAVWSVLYAIGLVAGYAVSFGEWLAGLEEWSRYLWIAFLGFLRRVYPLDGLLAPAGSGPLGRWALEYLGFVPLPELSAGVVLRYTAGTLYGLFVTALVSGVSARALGVVWLRAAGAPGGRWFGAALAGVRRPFGLAALYLLQTGIVLFLSLFLLLPGYYASYCFQLAFFLKVDHPEWGPVKCLCESHRRMRGYKLRAFWLDWSYWEVVTWAMVPLLGASVLLFPLIFAGIAWKMMSFLLIVICLIVALVLFWFANQYIGIGQAVLYREIIADETDF